MSAHLSNATPYAASPRAAAVVAGTLWHVPGAFGVARILGPRYSLRCVLFHDVSDSESSFTHGLDITVTRKQFEAALKFIKEHYTPVSLQDVLEANEAQPLPDRPLLLTFDDAYVSVSKFAAPLCAQYGVPAVFFVNGICLDNRQLALDNLVCHVANVCGMGTINAAIQAAGGSDLEVSSLKQVFSRFLPAISHETREVFRNALLELARIDDSRLAAEASLYLSSRQLRDLAGFNFEVGNHTYSHAHCRALCATDFPKEIDKNKAVLEEISGRKVRSFSVPYGSSRDLTAELAAHLARSGHEALFLAEGAANSWHRRGLALNRVSLRATSDATRFSEIEILPRLRTMRNSFFGQRETDRWEIINRATPVQRPSPSANSAIRADRPGIGSGV